MKIKKIIIALAATFAATFARADVTNYVYTVSNIYVRVFETRYITNRVQNTHYNYYFTNNVTTITNIWTVNHITNINYQVVFDNFGPWIAAASNQANRASAAAADATNQAAVAANYATTAGSWASSAQSHAASAASSAANAQNAANAGVSNINARIAWFDEHAGQTITNVNLSIDTSANFPHTSASGTTYENIRYYPSGNENGKICANPASYGPSTAFLVCLNLNRTGSPFGVPFYFDFGYMDSDRNGLRVHYVTRTKELQSCTVQSGVSRLALPRDFYWQDGNYFAVFDFYDGATNWETRITYQSNSSFTYPDNVRGSNNDSGQTWGYFDTYMSQAAVTGTTRPAVANFKTEKDSYLSNTTPLWVNETPTAEQQATIDWLNQFSHQ